ncbi:DUF6541 family protein [Dermabacteraceae bacterium P13103]
MRPLTGGGQPALLLAFFYVVTLAVTVGYGVLFLTLARSAVPFKFSYGFPLTVSLVGIWTLIFGVLGIPFTRLSVSAGMAASLLAAAAYGRYKPAAARVEPTGRGRSKDRWAVLSAVAVALLFAILPLLLQPDLHHRPQQEWDSLFHMSGTLAVRSGENAFPYGALADLYGGQQTYYPALWHAVSALIPLDVPRASTVLLLCAISAWPLGIPALVRSAARVRGRMLSYAVIASTVLSGGIVSYSYLGVMVGLWPYTLSLAMLPAALAALMRAFSLGVYRYHRYERLAEALLLVCGIALAHPSGLISLGVVFAPWMLLMLPWRRLPAIAHRFRYLLLGGLGAGAVALFFLLPGLLLRLRAMTRFQTDGASGYASFMLALNDRADTGLIAPTPYGNFIVLLLAAAGLIMLRRKLLPLAAMLVCAYLLVVLAGGPAWTVKAITAPWYEARHRLAPLAALLTVVAAGFGTSALACSLARLFTEEARGLARRGVLILTLAVSCLTSAGWRAAERYELASYAYDPAVKSYTNLLGPGEEEFIRETAPLVSSGKVIGDPYDGTSFYSLLGGVPVIYPGLHWIYAQPQLRVSERADSFASDPQLCRDVKRLGATYFYRDDSPDGMRQVREKIGEEGYNRLSDFPESALTLVAQRGNYRLYRINYPC